MTRKAYQPCRHCGQRRRHAYCGLCVACYRDATIRERYPYWLPCENCGRLRQATSPVPLCNECKKRPSLARQHGGYCQLGVPADDPVSVAIRALLASERPRVYPPAGWLPRCEHDREDGCCPQCERRQRMCVGNPTDEQEDDQDFIEDD